MRLTGPLLFTAQQPGESGGSGSHLPEEEPRRLQADQEHELLQISAGGGGIPHRPRGAALRGACSRPAAASWRLHPTHLLPFVLQSVFLKSVTLYNSGDFSSSARNMEEALEQYFEIHKSCLAGCEGSYEILEFKDFYPTLAGKTGPVPDRRRSRRARLTRVSSLRSLHGCSGL